MENLGGIQWEHKARILTCARNAVKYFAQALREVKLESNALSAAASLILNTLRTA